MIADGSRGWLWYAIGAAVLYGLHQIFTKLASAHISDGLGGLLVEGTAALTIAVYLAVLWASGRWDQHAAVHGVLFSVVTGVCVGAGTILFFVLFQRGGPLSAVPAILALGATIMAVAGFAFFGESVRPARLLGIALSVLGLYLLR